MTVEGLLKQIAELLGVFSETVHTVLKGTFTLQERWISHVLIKGQEQQRVRISNQLLFYINSKTVLMDGCRKFSHVTKLGHITFEPQIKIDEMQFTERAKHPGITKISGQ